MTAHHCNGECVCPLDGKPLIYWPAGDQHACQDPECANAHGFAGVPDEADGHSYRDMVNAPLRPETIAALNERLASGDYPVRKVPMRGSYPARPGRSTVAADRCPKCGGDSTDAWALCGTCETAEEQS